MNNDGKSQAIAEEFWRFSTGFYGRPRVAERLLEWQDTRGANVNLVLLCIWAGTRNRALSAEELARAEAAMAGWQAATVEPLRALRRRLKAEWRTLAQDAEPTRQAILAAELEAERAAQQLLVASLSPWPEPAGALDGPAQQALPQANLHTYLGASAADLIAALDL